MKEEYERISSTLWGIFLGFIFCAAIFAWSESTRCEQYNSGVIGAVKDLIEKEK